MLVQQKLRALELKKKHAARMAKAARRREAINARTAHLRSEVRAAQERGEAVAARPAKPMSLRRQLKQVYAECSQCLTVFVNASSHGGRGGRPCRAHGHLFPRPRGRGAGRGLQTPHRRGPHGALDGAGSPQSYHSMV